MAGLLLAGIGLQLLNPQIIRHFIDTAQAGGPARALALAALAYLGIGLAGRGLAFITFYAGQQVAWRATNALRADLVRHVLRLDMPFHTPQRGDGEAGRATVRRQRARQPQPVRSHRQRRRDPPRPG